jgi:hypothetical protein
MKLINFYGHPTHIFILWWILIMILFGSFSYVHYR